MGNQILSSMVLCAINFNQFNVLQNQLKNIEASILLAKLKFHQTYSKIKKKGEIWIARSREEIASWFNFSTKKVDRLLSLLERLGLIKKKAGIWNGEKKLFITVNGAIEQTPINTTLLKTLIEQTGSIKSAVIFSRIAYSLNNTKIEHNSLKWCCINKEELSKWSGISIRSIDTILENLLKSGLILKKNFIFKQKRQTHFHIPGFVIDVFTKRFKTTSENLKVPSTSKKPLTIDLKDQPKKPPNGNGQICLEQPAKTSIPIIKNTKIQKTNNNTYSTKIFTSHTDPKSDIIFDTLGKDLTQRQQLYLEAAIDRTVQRKKLNISNPKELWEQIKFSILTPLQHKGVETFRHTVSRCMKILGDGNWRTPIGFNTFSPYGAELKKTKDQELKAWENQKDLEKQTPKGIFGNISFSETFGIKQKNGEKLTQEAIGVGKKLKFLTKGKEAIVEYGSTLYWMVEELTKQIEGFIRQGANKEAVVAFLQKV